MADEQQPSSSPLDSDFLMTALAEGQRIDEPVDPHFVDSTEDDYGRLSESSDASEDDLSAGPGEDHSPAFGADPVGSAPVGPGELSDRQKTGLEVLGRGGSSGPVATAIYDTGGYGYDDDPAGTAGAEEAEADGDHDGAEHIDPVDAGAGAGAPPTTTPGAGKRRGKQKSPRARIGMLVGATIALVLVVGLMVKACMPSGNEPTAAKAPPFTTATTAASATATEGPAVADGPIPIESAEGVGCQPGSTNGMSAFDDNPDTAWVCVVKTSKDAAKTPVPKMLRVKFKGSFIVVGVSLIPGFERKNADGSDEWIKHMVVSEIAYTFNDRKSNGDCCTRYTQPTLSLRSGARTAINPPLLASGLVIDINKYAAPAGSAGTAGGPTQGPDTNAAVPTFGAPQPGKEASSPSDFAVSAIVIYGHKPA